MQLTLVAPCHFGMESVLKREIYDLGYEISRVEDGRVSFEGDIEAICRANIFLRTCERVMIEMARFPAKTFDELFEGIKAIEWENFIPKDSKFYVAKASGIKSKLYSASDMQSIGKKAMVDRLSKVYGISQFPETGQTYPVRIFIMKDVASVCLDTTGTPLFKRGYRKLTAQAPIAETLAASLIMLSPWHRDRILIDPFCGSGTFLIEAAMIGASIAPGARRDFISSNWDNLIEKSMWKDIYEEALDLEDRDYKMDLQGFDIDPEMVAIAKKNAADAGVNNFIHFQRKDVADVSHRGKYGFIITNPPYGKRLLDEEELPVIYSALGDTFSSLNEWSMYMITSYEDASRYIGRDPDKNRKIYNGMIKTYLYQYMGAKPPKRQG